MSKNIVWPKKNNEGEIVKDGTIDSVSFAETWEGCKKAANEYAKKNYPELLKAQAKEKAEIRAIWAKMSKEERGKIENTKGNYIG